VISSKLEIPDISISKPRKHKVSKEAKLQSVMKLSFIFSLSPYTHAHILLNFSTSKHLHFQSVQCFHSAKTKSYSAYTKVRIPVSLNIFPSNLKALVCFLCLKASNITLDKLRFFFLISIITKNKIKFNLFLW
jgi:hypothetical protein